MVSSTVRRRRDQNRERSDRDGSFVGATGHLPARSLRPGRLRSRSWGPQESSRRARNQSLVVQCHALSDKGCKPVRTGHGPVLRGLAKQLSVDWPVVAQVANTIFELGKLLQEDQVYSARRTVALLRQQQLGDALQVLALGLVDFFAEDERD